MRSMNANDTYTQAAIRVAAPIDDPDFPVFSEVMAAAPDPADPDQAILLNVPFLVDGLNFGDIVRLGPEDERGVRPIFEVVHASGHVHLLAATEEEEDADLIAHLERTFPSYALRIEGARGHVLSISVHPDLESGAVREAVEAWLGMNLADHEESLAVGPACASQLGPVFWAPRSRPGP
jgi:hypothetical protein